MHTISCSNISICVYKSLLYYNVYRMLNFTGAIHTGYGYTYGYGHGMVWLSQVNSPGNETNLGQCSFLGWGINNCYHYYDVNVVCDSESRKCITESVDSVSRNGPDTHI